MERCFSGGQGLLQRLVSPMLGFGQGSKLAGEAEWQSKPS